MKVSVIVATYGTQHWADLGRTVLSSAAMQDPHEAFAFHDSDPSMTLSRVRNTAAMAATGDWLCFLDADDILDNGYLSAMYKARTRKQRESSCECEPESCLFVPAVGYLSDGLQGTPAIPAWGRPLEEINCAVIGTLIHRSVFMAVGGFREWPMYEDWDLWLRAVRYGCSLVPVPDAVYLSTVNPNGRNAGPQSRKTYDAIRADLGIK